MKIEKKMSFQKKILQFALGVFIGIALWGATLFILLILN